MRESCLVYCYSGIQSLFEVVLLYTFYIFCFPAMVLIAYRFWNCIFRYRKAISVAFSPWISLLLAELNILRHINLGCQRTTLVGMEWKVQRNIEWKRFRSSARTYQTVSAGYEFWIKLCSFWDFFGYFYIPMPHRSKISSAHHGLITEKDKVYKLINLKAF